MKYQYDNKGMAATCLYCGQDYSKHEKDTLKCRKLKGV